MTKTRFAPWVVVACIGTLAGCSNSGEGAAGNTELNVLVPPAGTQSVGGPETDVQSVEYTINCTGAGGENGPFLGTPGFDDAVTINGNLEVQDGRTNPTNLVCAGGDNPGAACAVDADCQGTSPVPDGTCSDPALPNFQAEVWQGFMDLPPGPCTVQLRARDADGEVICNDDSGTFNIVADGLTKVNMVLLCGVSFQAPVGMLDVDATFSFEVANYCPDLFVFNAIDSAPAEQFILNPITGDPLAIAFTTIEARFRDGDNQCGDSCDPQTCDVNTDGSGLTCTAGADPGEPSTTIVCTSNPGPGEAETALLDCDFNFIPEAACTLLGTGGEYLGNLVPTPPYPAPAPNPGLNASALVGCIPPGGIPGTPITAGEPGAVITCFAETTDGDLDCNKQKILTVTCPGNTPCQDFAGGAPVQCDETSCPACDDGNECTVPICDNGSCAGDFASCCDAIPLTGTACTFVDPGGSTAPGTCNAGVCDLAGCLVDTDCAGPNPDACQGQSTCDTATNLCNPPPPGNSGGNCVSGVGSGDGTCDAAGTCVSDDACGVPGAPACTEVDGLVCTVPSCDTAVTPYACTEVPGNDGGSCDFATGGVGTDGQCNGGVCGPLAAAPQTALTILSCSLPAAVSTNVVPFPAQITVTPTTAVVGGGTFSAGIDPSVVLDQAFLQTAAVTLYEGFGIFFTEVNLTSAQVQMAATAGCGQVCVGGGFNEGTACTTDAECDADGVQPYTGQCIASPGALTLDAGPLPRILPVPTAPWPCSTDADCLATNAIGTGTCDGTTCDPTTVPSQVVAGITLDNFPEATYSCTTAASGTLAICATGIREAVGPTTPPSETFVRVDVGALTNVGFDCETGSAQNPNECLCPGGSTCLDAVNCPAGAFCIVDPGVTSGNCSTPTPATLKYDPTGSICSPQDANAGETCTTNADCDAACDLSAVPTDPQAGECSDASSCVFPNASDQCLGTGGGTCIPACVQYPIL